MKVVPQVMPRAVFDLDCRKDACRVPINHHGIQLLNIGGISGDNNFVASICINIGVWAKVLMYPNFISIHLKIILTFKPVLWEEKGIEIKAERYY